MNKHRLSLGGIIVITVSLTMVLNVSMLSQVVNPGFESGTSPWTFHTDGQGAFARSSPGNNSSYAGRVSISTQGTNVQLYQDNLRLEANTQYKLVFKAYANTGHDLSVSLLRQTSPYGSYGMSNVVYNLTTSWQTFTMQFNTTGFTGVVTNARLRFWLAPYDAGGDQYFLDDISLTKVGSSGPPTITQHPQSQNVSPGETATFSVSTSGTQPVTYQWQKNNVGISGATASTYTTPPVTTADDGSLFRAVVSNSAGSATSNSGMLNATAGNSDLVFQRVTIDNNAPRSPHCKAIGDINGDGFNDLLAASSSGYTEGLFWYKYPSWTKHSIRTGSFSTSMQVADIDGDGDLDAIIPKGNDYGASVWIYVNPRPSGNPETGPWQEVLVGDAGAHDLEIGDINKDGKPDIVARMGATVTLFFQNSLTSWTKRSLTTRQFEGTSLGDIDGDSDLDIAINGYWLENPLPGGNPRTAAWTERLVNSGWLDKLSVHIADINGDGRKDILFAPSEYTGGKLAWYESTSPRTGPWTEHVMATNVGYIHTLKTADMDRDGDVDVVTAEMHQSTNPDEVSVYRNNGTGLSWTKVVLATSGSHNARLGDIGNDGKVDIVGANWSESAPNGAPLEMWKNVTESSGSSLDSWTRRVVDTGKPWRSLFITAADINGDGRKDIITGGWWYKNPGSPGGSWVRGVIGSPLNNMAAVHDFDNDGDPDVLGTRGQGSATNAQFSWARNNGSGTFSILGNIPTGEGDFLQGVAVGQFQNPLEVALSWHNGTTGVQMLTVPANPSSTNWTWRRISTTSQGEQLSAGDIDRDGDTDLALGTQWLRNGGTSWSTFQTHGTGGSPDRNRLADINNDGRLDVVVGFEAISVAGKLAWYGQPTTATGQWSEHVISSSVVGPMSLDVADVDHDGDLDVVVGEHNLNNPGSARMIVFENTDGFGNSWTQHVVSTGDEHHDGAHVVDIDNDGDLDILSIGWGHARVLLYENTSNGTGPSGPAVATMATGGEEAPEVPSEFMLYQNYPNPFNPSTTIRYGLPKDALVTVRIYNTIGQLVRTLEEQTQNAGYHDVVWDGKNDGGMTAATGIYICRMEAMPRDGSVMFTMIRKLSMVQ